MVYVISYFFVLFQALVVQTKQFRVGERLSKFFFLISLVPAIFFVAFRGLVGTDTINYIDFARAASQCSISNIIYGKEINVELGFRLLLYFVTFIVQNPQWAINIISAILAIYFTIVFSKTRRERIVYSLLLFPLCFFSIAMSGLRAGLAFILCYHAARCFLHRKYVVFVVISVLAISIQVSTAIILILFAVRRMQIKNLIGAAIFIPAIVFLFNERLSHKLLVYKNFTSPDMLLSGIFPLTILVVIWIAFYRDLIEYKVVMWLMLVMAIAAFVLARYSYAGLRFLDLILFSVICFVTLLSSSKLKIKKLFVCCFIIGLVCFVGEYRYFLGSKEVSTSPFLPYIFIWENR